MNTNMLFTELSGYFKREIIERNIEKIMPEVFCTNEVHNEKIINWVEVKEAEAYEEYCTNSAYIGNKNLGYIKQKVGYITPVQYKINYYHTEENFVVTFKTLSYEQNQCHFILDQNGIIRDCSHMSNALFGLDKTTLETR